MSTKAMICIIPAAGKGLRARPEITMVPKGMLSVKKKPLLEHSLEIVRDQLGIETIIMIIGHLGEIIEEYFGDGKKFGVNIRYVHNHELDRGLAWSIYLGRVLVRDNFLVLLGDEYYHRSNHYLLKEIDMAGILACCGVRRSEDRSQIAENYSVHCAGERIVRLIEKPRHISSNLMGTGTFVLSSEIFEIISRSFYRYPETIPNFIDILDQSVREGKIVRKVELLGEYVNINDSNALRSANLL